MRVLFLAIVLMGVAAGASADEILPKGYPPHGPLSIGTVQADCSGKRAVFDSRKTTAYLVSCFLKAIAEVDVDKIKSVDEARIAYSGLASDAYFAAWDKHAAITIGKRDGYVPLRFEDLSFSFDRLGYPSAIYGWLISGNGTDERRAFYSISFSGVGSKGLIMDRLLDKEALLKTYDKKSWPKPTN